MKVREYMASGKPVVMFPLYEYKDKPPAFASSRTRTNLSLRSKTLSSMTALKINVAAAKRLDIQPGTIKHEGSASSSEASRWPCGSRRTGTITLSRQGIKKLAVNDIGVVTGSRSEEA